MRAQMLKVMLVAALTATTVSYVAGKFTVPTSAAVGATASIPAAPLMAFLTASGQFDLAARAFADSAFQDAQTFEARRADLLVQAHIYYNALELMAAVPAPEAAAAAAAARAATETFNTHRTMIANTPAGEAMGPYWQDLSALVVERQKIMQAIGRS